MNSCSRRRKSFEWEGKKSRSGSASPKSKIIVSGWLATVNRDELGEVMARGNLINRGGKSHYAEYSREESDETNVKHIRLVSCSFVGINTFDPVQHRD